MRRLIIWSTILSLLLLNIIPVKGAVSTNHDGIVVSVDFHNETIISDDIDVEFHSDLNQDIPLYGQVDEEVIEIIDGINHGEELEAALDHETIINELNLHDYHILTNLDDLIVYDHNNNIILHPQNITVTWEVPNLTRNLIDIRVLHYSNIREVWEILMPDNINFDDKLITCTFQDLSPVCVIYKTISNETVSKATGDDHEYWSFYTLIISGVVTIYMLKKYY